MGLANVEIIRFTGSVAEADRNPCNAYLIVVDGEYPKSYGKPKYTFPPKPWIDRHLRKTYDVGSAHNWKEFFAKCTSILYREAPLSGNDSRMLIRKHLESHSVNNGKANHENNSVSRTIDELVEELIALP